MGLLERFKTLKRLAGTYYWDLYCKDEFLRSCPPNARILDVGCGNDSPARFKQVRPDLYYVGLDIADYNQNSDPNQFADEYIITTPQKFNESIECLPTTFDAVVSAHNIEHCNFPQQTLAAMLSILKPGGRIFLAFPSEASVNFPHRKGTLNFYDDPTHIYLPSFSEIRATLTARGCTIDVERKRYRPLVRALRGLLKEPRCRWRGTVEGDIWSLYGFETIIWATRRSTASITRSTPIAETGPLERTISASSPLP
jgi:SAM-dependent methyltransferase